MMMGRLESQHVAAGLLGRDRERLYLPAVRHGLVPAAARGELDDLYRRQRPEVMRMRKAINFELDWLAPESGTGQGPTLVDRTWC